MPELLVVLERVPGLAARFAAVKLGTPIIGSSEFEDRRVSYAGSRPGDAATIRLVVAVDHLALWRHLALEDHLIPIWAHLSLMRVAIEGAVQARWVLDPTVNPSERVERALGLALDDLRWAVRAMNAMAQDPNWSPEHGEKMVHRKAEVEDGARDAGLTPKRSTTEAKVERFCHRPFDLLAYRLTSGVVHAQVWASLQGKSETVARTATMTTEKIEADQGTAFLVTRTAVDLFEDAVSDYEAYIQPHGLSAAPLSSPGATNP
jgi:hypothetical protein